MGVGASLLLLSYFSIPSSLYWLCDWYLSLFILMHILLLNFISNWYTILYIISWPCNSIILFSLHSACQPLWFYWHTPLLHLLSTSQYIIFSLNWVLTFKIFKKRNTNSLIFSHLFTTLLILHLFCTLNVPSGISF